MVGFPNWCDQAAEDVGAHALKVITARAADTADGCAAVAAIVPNHYAAEEHVARILRRLGRPRAAAFIEGKLPTTKAIRSGDLGEILATEYIAAGTQYSAPIKRLRWKDHRNMAMRGDDVIALMRDPASGRLQFLKTEAKSRAALASGVLAEARAGLDKDSGLPSAHALEFIADRLMEAGETALADAIDDALLKHGIAPQSVKHLLFTFSGNNPANLLRANLQGYGGTFRQLYVGVQVGSHGPFIADVYDRVIANANNG
jgi:HamA